MNINKSFIRSWISLVSVAGFIASWFFFVRASEVRKNQQGPNPDATVQVNLTPIPNLDDLITSVPATLEGVQKFTLFIPIDQPTPLPIATLPKKSALPTAIPTLAPILLPTSAPVQPSLTPGPVVQVTPRFHTGGS